MHGERERVGIKEPWTRVYIYIGAAQVTTNTTVRVQRDIPLGKRWQRGMKEEEERVNACILLHECAYDELVVSRRGVIISVAGLYVACPESAVTNGLLPDGTGRKAICTPPAQKFSTRPKNVCIYIQVEDRCCTHEQRFDPQRSRFHPHRLLTKVTFWYARSRSRRN